MGGGNGGQDFFFYLMKEMFTPNYNMGTIVALEGISAAMTITGLANRDDGEVCK